MATYSVYDPPRQAGGNCICKSETKLQFFLELTKQIIYEDRLCVGNQT